MNVVLPAIEQDLDTNLSVVQWVVNGYSLVFGVLIVPGGRLADLFRRTRILILGAAIFAGFSLLGAFAPNVTVLIITRILMAVGGAMMWPSPIAMIATWRLVHVDTERQDVGIDYSGTALLSVSLLSSANVPPARPVSFHRAWCATVRSCGRVWRRSRCRRSSWRRSSISPSSSRKCSATGRSLPG